MAGEGRAQSAEVLEHAGHAHDGPATPVTRTARSWLAVALAPFVLATAVGLVVLWPSSHHFAVPPQFQTQGGKAVAYVHATTTSLKPTPCAGSGGESCLTAHFRLTSGSVRGDAAVLLTPGAGEPVVHVGDRVVLARASDEQGRPAYYFEDFARGLPLGALAVVFALLAVVVGRRRGFAALLGLGVAFAVLVEFVLPALLSGRDPVLVALTAGSAVMIVVLYLGHGLSARTTVAVLGTLGGLALVAGIGALAVGRTHLTGLSSDDLTAVQASAPRLHATGILIAGLVIGSLGVLNDVTVTQASAVWELHHANPDLGRRRLYGAAMRIGRDHIASTIYTLILAYAGAALPVLLLFTQSEQPLGDVLGGDLVGSDIVRSLTGAIGLLLAVPLTTALAMLVVTHTVEERPSQPDDATGGRHARARGTSWS
ncbi:MAG: hypothetical protein QOI82_773 [Actinomycetota bacterium]|nr:hypothetical protein [Actinomycetota bacterium]